MTILRVLDGLWETYEWVPKSEVTQRIPPVPFDKKVKKMEELGLILWRKLEEPYLKITEKGLDTLAVWDFQKHGIITDIGSVVGEGKEAVVVLARKDDTNIALKFHRYYSAEFRKIKESLSYSAIKWWKQKIGRNTRPIDISRAKAQIEYHALNTLQENVRVPRPLGINRHVVAMEFLGNEGIPSPLLHELGKGSCKKEDILDDYNRAVDMGVVHGDLSPYNIIIHRNLPYLIDWPQAVPKDFEGAKELTERDKLRIDEFFA